MAGGGGGRGSGALRISDRPRGLVGWAGVRAGSARTVAASRPTPTWVRLGAGNGKALVSPPAIASRVLHHLRHRSSGKQRGHSVGACTIINLT